MITQRYFCPKCSREVLVTLTPAPTHLGHADLGGLPEPVCLDFGEHCADAERCALTGELRLVMGARAARSGLRDGSWETALLPCPVCEEARELEILDGGHAYCRVCGTTVALPGRGEPEGYN